MTGKLVTSRRIVISKATEDENRIHDVMLETGVKNYPNFLRFDSDIARMDMIRCNDFEKVLEKAT